jgi:mycofactocin precursor
MTDPTLEARPATFDPEVDGVAAQQPPAKLDEPLVEADLLIEDVSIDGMCGVD